MTENYKKTLLRLSTAQICASIGYNSTQSSSLELLQDILNKFLIEFARDLRRHVEHYNRSGPQLKDLLLTIRNLKINVKSLKEYIDNVEQSAFYVGVPKFPKFGGLSLKFPKYGVAEDTIIRPFYVFEYLPPMSNCREEPMLRDESFGGSENIENNNLSIHQDIRADSSSKLKSAFREEHGIMNRSLVTTGLKSAFMTSTGYISPSVEGRTADTLIPSVFEKWKDLDAPPPPPKKKETGITKEEPVEKKIIPMMELDEQLLKENFTFDVIKKEGTVPLAPSAPPEDLKPSELKERSAKLTKKMCASLPQANENLSTVNVNDVNFHKPIPSFERIQDKQLKMSPLADVELIENAKVPSEKQIKKLEKLKQKTLKKACRNDVDIPLLPPPLVIPDQRENIDVSVNVKDLGQHVLAVNDLKKSDSISENFQNDDNKMAYNKWAHESFKKKLDMKGVNTLYKCKKSRKVAAAVPPLITLPAEQNFQSTKFQDPGEKTGINLPSGTTITPAPFLPPPQSNLLTNTMKSDFLDKPESNSLDIEMGKVMGDAFGKKSEIIKKKRGRKPGSKNTPKIPVNTNFNNISSMNLLTKDNSQINFNISQNSKSDTLLTPRQDKQDNVINKIEGSERKRKRIKKNMDNVLELDEFGKVIADISPEQDKQKQNRKTESNITQTPVTTAKLVDYNNEAEITSLKLGSVNPFSNGSGLFHTPFRTDDLPSRNFNRPNPNPFSPISLFPFPQGPGLIPPSNLLFTNPDVQSSHEFLNFPNFKDDKDICFDTKNLKNGNNIGVLSEQMPPLVDGPFCNVASLIPDFMTINSQFKQVSEDLIHNNQRDDIYNIQQQKRPPPPQPPTCTVTQKIAEYQEILNYGCHNILQSQIKSTLTQKNKIFPNNLFQTDKWISQKILKDDNKVKSFNLSSQPINEPIEVSDDSNDTMKPPTANQNCSLDFRNDIGVVANRKFSQKKKMIQDGTTDTKIIRKHISKNLVPNKQNNPVSISELYESDCGTSFKKLAGGADLIPLSGSNTGLAYSAKSIPPTSLTANSFTGNDLKNMAPKTTAGSEIDTVIIPSSNILDNCSVNTKDIKKSKKPKDEKIKKKKEKKEKIKAKDHLISSSKEILLESRDKNLAKKRKREKKKSKLVREFYGNYAETVVNCKEQPADSTNPSLNKTSGYFSINAGGAVDNNDFKIDVSQQVSIPETCKEDFENNMLCNNSVLPANDSLTRTQKIAEFRDMSPELARISPLVTRPPKQKHNNAVAATTTASLISSNTLTQNISELPPPSPWVSGGTLAASSVLLPQQLLQSAIKSSANSFPIREVQKAHTDAVVAPASFKSSYVDSEGNTVWICPACGKVDDGSPMIGCDGCDAWYHWSCVGIFIAPKDNEDWFCRFCTLRKKGLTAPEKRKKRSKKKLN